MQPAWVIRAFRIMDATASAIEAGRRQREEMKRR
jgi:hypothetical protein